MNETTVALHLKGAYLLNDYTAENKGMKLNYVGKNSKIDKFRYYYFGYISIFRNFLFI